MVNNKGFGAIAGITLGVLALGSGCSKPLILEDINYRGKESDRSTGQVSLYFGEGIRGDKLDYTATDKRSLYGNEKSFDVGSRVDVYGKKYWTGQISVTNMVPSRANF
jgi:hypothetical protein